MRIVWQEYVLMLSLVWFHFSESFQPSGAWRISLEVANRRAPNFNRNGKKCARMSLPAPGDPMYDPVIMQKAETATKIFYAINPFGPGSVKDMASIPTEDIMGIPGLVALLWSTTIFAFVLFIFDYFSRRVQSDLQRGPQYDADDGFDKDYYCAECRGRRVLACPECAGKGFLMTRGRDMAEPIGCQFCASQGELPCAVCQARQDQMRVTSAKRLPPSPPPAARPPQSGNDDGFL